MAIKSITLRKKMREYRIVRRNPITGEISTTYSNRLTEEEKAWARSNTYYEDPYVIEWIKR